jgi:hypothetical protein
MSIVVTLMILLGISVVINVVLFWMMNVYRSEYDKSIRKNISGGGYR